MKERNPDNDIIFLQRINQQESLYKPIAAQSYHVSVFFCPFSILPNLCSEPNRKTCSLYTSKGTLASHHFHS